MTLHNLYPANISIGFLRTDALPESGDCHSAFATLPQPAVARLSTAVTVGVVAVGEWDVAPMEPAALSLRLPSPLEPSTWLTVSLLQPPPAARIPAFGSVELEVEVSLPPTCEGEHLTSPACLEASSWHRLCFHVLQRGGVWLDTTGAAGPVVGCFDTFATTGVVGGFEPGNAALAVWAQRQDGAAASKVHVVQLVFTSVSGGDVEEVDVGAGLPSSHLSAGSGATKQEEAVPDPQGASDLASMDLEAVRRQAVEEAPEAVVAKMADAFPPLPCPVEFVVLVLGLPSPENRNLQVFEDIALSVHQVGSELHSIPFISLRARSFRWG